MVIEDRELIGDGSGSEFSIPNIPLGIFFENKIQNNIADYGDTTWLVISEILRFLIRNYSFLESISLF